MTGRTLKLLAGVSAGIFVLVLGFWVVSGAGLVTQYQVAVTETIEDEFGDAVEQTVLEDQFRFGLMPDKGPDGALPYLGFFGLAAVGFFVLGVRKDKNSGKGTEKS